MPYSGDIVKMQDGKLALVGDVLPDDPRIDHCVVSGYQAEQVATVWVADGDVYFTRPDKQHQAVYVEAAQRLLDAYQKAYSAALKHQEKHSVEITRVQVMRGYNVVTVKYFGGEYDFLVGEDLQPTLSRFVPAEEWQSMKIELHETASCMSPRLRWFMDDYWREITGR